VRIRVQNWPSQRKNHPVEMSRSGKLVDTITVPVLDTNIIVRVHVKSTPGLRIRLRSQAGWSVGRLHLVPEWPVVEERRRHRYEMEEGSYIGVVRAPSEAALLEKAHRKAEKYERDPHHDCTGMIGVLFMKRCAPPASGKARKKKRPAVDTDHESMA